MGNRSCRSGNRRILRRTYRLYAGPDTPLSFTRFHSSVLPLHGLTGVGWSDSSEYARVREQGNRVDIITRGTTLRFAFDGDSDTAVNPYHAQYIPSRRDDYPELFDRDALSSRFFMTPFRECACAAGDRRYQ